MISTMTAVGQPRWRPLTAIVLVVALAHLLVLRAAPAQLGSGSDTDAADGKTLVTRSIQAAPPPAAEATLAAPVAAKPIKTAKNIPKKASNSSLDQTKYALAAPEIVAQVDPPMPPAPPLETTANATPTQAVPPALAVAGSPPSPTSSAAVLPAATAALALAGPKTTPVTAVNLPGSVRLLYKVVGTSKSMNYQANAELAWKSNGDNYEAMMKVSAFLIGSRSMTSVGKITGIGLAPTRFADKFKAELAAHFDPDSRKITFSANTPDATWIEGAQDRVSVFLQLGGMLAADPTGFAPGSSITFLTIGPREADTWTFVIEAEEALELLGGPLRTLKVTRKPRKEFDQKVEIWYAPSLGYLPVRNRITQQNGDFIDQQLTEFVKG